MFFLIPLAPGLKDEPGLRDRYFNEMRDRLEQTAWTFVRTLCTSDRRPRRIQEDYRAFKGNAYGLANTLRQTAFWKPKMKSKLPGLFFTAN